jgi:hypothetical protein
VQYRAPVKMALCNNGYMSYPLPDTQKGRFLSPGQPVLHQQHAFCTKLYAEKFSAIDPNGSEK